jgi:hypothetical protein
MVLNDVGYHALAMVWTPPKLHVLATDGSIYTAGFTLMVTLAGVKIGQEPPLTRLQSSSDDFSEFLNQEH